MALFRNLLGDVDNPFFIEIVQRGFYTDNQARTIPCLNVWHFRRLTNGLAFDPTDIGGVFTADLQTAFLAATNVGYTWEQTECRGMDDPAAATAITPVGDPGTVGNAASAYTSLAAAKFTHYTGFRGRSFLGGKHFAGLDEAHVTQCEINATGQALWDAVALVQTNWVSGGLEDSAGNTWVLCVLSPTLSSTGPTDIPGIFTGADVSSIKYNLTVGSMNGRKEGFVQR